MKRCPQCGVQDHDEAILCKNCMRNFASGPPVPARAATKRKASSFPTFLVLLIVGAIVFAVKSPETVEELVAVDERGKLGARIARGRGCRVASRRVNARGDAATGGTAAERRRCQRGTATSSRRGEWSTCDRCTARAESTRRAACRREDAGRAAGTSPAGATAPGATVTRCRSTAAHARRGADGCCSAAASFRTAHPGWRKHQGAGKAP